MRGLGKREGVSGGGGLPAARERVVIGPGRADSVSFARVKRGICPPETAAADLVVGGPAAAAVWFADALAVTERVCLPLGVLTEPAAAAVCPLAAARDTGRRVGAVLVSGFIGEIGNGPLRSRSSPFKVRFKAGTSSSIISSITVRLLRGVLRGWGGLAIS